jgi:DNA-binding transcriptional LysR family regulator
VDVNAQFHVSTQAAEWVRRMLSWDDFRYVKAIAEARSLAGAGARLRVNQSTVFRRLAQIEEHLGSRLFARGRAGYALTACGEQMVELAERMWADIIDFERRVKGDDPRPSGELRITTSDALLRHLLSAVFVAFRRAYPEITLNIVVSNQRFNLTKSDTDVAVRATYHNPEPLAGLRIARIAWAVFGAAAHAAESFDPARDSRRHDWIAFADAAAITRATKWLQEHADQGRIVYKINTMVGLAEAAAADAGLALLPCYIGTVVPGLAQLSQPLPDLESELWLLTHPDVRNTARVRAFLDFCSDEIAGRGSALAGVPAATTR